MKRYLITCVLLGCSLSPRLMASAEECSGIEDDAVRLTCYDKFFRQPAEEPSPQVSEQSLSADAIEPSLLEGRIADEAALADQLFSITPHRPNYILPATYNVDSDYSTYSALGETFSNTEIKMQVSLKTRLAKGMWRDSSIWSAYTQQSYWQLYADTDASSPFRETNHEPEIFWQVPTDFNLLGWRARIATLGLNHQSNGRSNPLSRSWNRVTAELTMDRGSWVASAKTWRRIEEDAESDDNPDIEDYMGRLELRLVHKRERNTFALRVKNNLSSDNRSGVEINWTFPLTKRLKGFVQVYSGYGENLIDMENYSNRIGVGISLTDWL